MIAYIGSGRNKQDFYSLMLLVLLQIDFRIKLNALTSSEGPGSCFNNVKNYVNL